MAHPMQHYGERRKKQVVRFDPLLDSLYQISFDPPDYDTCLRIPARSGCSEMDMFMVPAEPDYEAGVSTAGRVMGELDNFEAAILAGIRAALGIGGER